MKNQNIVIAERLGVKQVVIMIRNAKEILKNKKKIQFCKSKVDFLCFVFLMIAVRSDKRDHHDKSSSYGC